MSDPTQIIWPAHHDPASAPIHVRNELAIPAPPETVWAWLIRASRWPSWYPNSANVSVLDGSPPDLALRTRFRWKTFGVTIESTVLECVPPQRLAWDAHAIGVDAYHAWLVTRTAEGCHVLTEETQHGFMARLGKLLMPNRMYSYHQIWLEGLRTNAVKGMPPAA
jgi:uncharacterized protein YndB with AHSA1/START domain